MIRLTTAQGKPFLLNPRHIIHVSPHESASGNLTEIFTVGPQRLFFRDSFDDVEDKIAEAEADAEKGRTVAGTPLSESD